MSQPEERKAARMPMQKGHAGCPQDSEGLQGASHCYEKTRVRKGRPLDSGRVDRISRSVQSGRPVDGRVLTVGSNLAKASWDEKAALSDGPAFLVGLTGFEPATP